MAILWLSYLLKTYDEIIEALPSCTVSEPWQALQDYFTRSLKLSLQSKLRCGVDHYFATITWSSCPEALKVIWKLWRSMMPRIKLLSKCYSSLLKMKTFYVKWQWKLFKNSCCCNTSVVNKAEDSSLVQIICQEMNLRSK
jgi:hypothetical protein